MVEHPLLWGKWSACLRIDRGGDMAAAVGGVRAIGGFCAELRLFELFFGGEWRR